MRIQRCDALRAKLSELNLGEPDVAAAGRLAERPLRAASEATAGELMRVLGYPNFKLSAESFLRQLGIAG